MIVALKSDPPDLTIGSDTRRYSVFRGVPETFSGGSLGKSCVFLDLPGRGLSDPLSFSASGARSDREIIAICLYDRDGDSSIH